MAGFYIQYLESEFNMFDIHSATNSAQAFATGVVGSPHPTSVSFVSRKATARRTVAPWAMTAQ